MSDLISRSALIEILSKNSIFEKITCGDKNIYEIIDELPTVDAVEVVRCKDCIYYNPRWHTCMGLYLSGQTLVNGYCFNGMRKKVLE